MRAVCPRLLADGDRGRWSRDRERHLLCEGDEVTCLRKGC